MPITTSSLGQPARHSARIVALDRLARVRDCRERLGAAGDDDALHDFRVAVRRLRSWLRAFRTSLDDTVSRREERGLKRIARATGECRDLEVHIAWVEGTRSKESPAQHNGSEWLLKRLRARQAVCDRELHRVVSRRFDPVVRRLHASFSRYVLEVEEPDPNFGDCAAMLIRSHASDFGATLRRIEGIGDRDGAHEARIAAKRLRYLAEPFGPIMPSVAPVVEELSQIQDALGALHDAQVFSTEIEAAIASVRSRASDPMPGLRAMLRKLRTDEQAAFQLVTERWLSDGAAGLIARVTSLKL